MVTMASAPESRSTALSEELSSVVDAALLDARRHHQSRWPGLLWPRAIVIRAPARLPRFGALIWLNILFVDRRLEAAPKDVVSAIVAHEYGHVARGHAAAGLAVVFAVLVLMVTPPGSAVSRLAAVGVAALYLAIVAGLVWLRRPAREFEADSFGAAVVGRDAIVDALNWIAAWSGQGWTPALAKRRAELMSRPI